MPNVWIDTAECMGAGTCEDIAPDVFAERRDGTWAVREAGQYFGAETIFDGLNQPGHGPDGAQGRARVPEGLVDVVVEAAEECPGECIFVEV